MNRPFERIPRWLRLTPLQWAVVIGAAVLAAMLGFFFQSQKQDTYAATAKVLFRNAQLDPGSSVFTGSADPQRDAATNVRLIVSNSMAARVAEVAGIPASQADALLGQVKRGLRGRHEHRRHHGRTTPTPSGRRCWPTPGPSSSR